jgi:hypothetical protein
LAENLSNGFQADLAQRGAGCRSGTQRGAVAGLWNLGAWIRAREVLAGEDAVKAGGEKYLPRLEAQTDEEYAACRA